jgi:hypothetical protein
VPGLKKRRQRSGGATGARGRGPPPAPGVPDDRLDPKIVWLAGAAIVVAAAIVRVAAASGELWLDEIWSFRLAGFQDTALAVFTAIHHDNNHHLNTLFLYFVPETASWITYRLHVILAGTLTVLLAGVIARRGGDRTGLIAILLCAASYLLVLYSSEARGYALAVCFGFLAIPLADKYFSTGSFMWALAFGAAAALGFLSHLTLLQAYAGLLAWTGWRALRSGQGRVAVRFATLHALPCAALAVLYWIDLRHVVIGGGPNLTAAEILARTLSLALGGPQAGPWRGVVAAAALMLFAAGIHAVRRSGSDLWVLFLVTTFIAPALTLAFTRSSLLYERYFLVAVAFGLLAAGWSLASIARRSRIAAVAIVAAYVFANGTQVARLLRDGRGSYIPALTRISEQAVQRPVTIGSDHDFRQGRLVEFYQRFVSRGADIEYHEPFEWAAAGPEWYLVHSEDPGFEPVADLAVEGRRYRLAVTYRHHGLSGWNLSVYHNALAER